MSNTYILRKGHSQLSDLKDGGAALGTGAGAKTIYYCDNNCGNDSNDGLSWASPFKTLAHALEVSHADIASGMFGWAARNVIYYRADAETADLTKLAQKTDIVGVGSYDHRPRPGIIGNHVIGTASYMGCRFFNVHFKTPAAGGDIFTIPTEQSGIEFHGCLFDGNSTTKATGAIVATSVESLVIQDCVTQGAFSDAVFEIAGVENNGLLIQGNMIQGGQQGIDVKATVTTSIRSGRIMENTINCVTEGINEASGKIYVHRNYVVTAANKGTAGAGAIVAGAKMMLQNYAACGDATGLIIPANASL